MVFVADDTDGAVLGFPATANGSPTPSSVIEGPNTTLLAESKYGSPPAALLAFDGIGNLYTGPDQGSAVAVFPTGANGNIMPSYTLNAPEIDGITIDSAGDTYIASPSTTTPSASPQIEIFAKGATKNATPFATISGSNTGLYDPRSMAVDANGSLYVVNYPGLDTMPEILIFAKAAMNKGTVNLMPSGTITSADTDGEMQIPTGLVIDNMGDLIVSDEQQSSIGKIFVFSKDIAGEIINSATISSSGMGAISGVAVDESNNIWVSDTGNSTSYPKILEFAAGSSGDDVTPIKQIIGDATMIKQPYQIVYVPGSAIMNEKSRRSLRGGPPTRRGSEMVTSSRARQR